MAHRCRRGAVTASVPHLETLYQAGTFRPPWLWTITRLIEEAAAEAWPLSVGGFDDFPPPVAVAQNCPSCDGRVLAAIEAHRQTGAFAHPGQCTCSAVWDSAIREPENA